MTELTRPARPWDRTPSAEREYEAVLGPGLVAVLPPHRPEEGGSTGWQPPTGGAWLHLARDGTVRAFTGKAEVGQGTRGALTLVVAEELRVPPASVHVLMGDTDLCPWDMGTFGSRSMPDAARALGTVAAGARAWLVDRAAKAAGLPADSLEANDGAVRGRSGSPAVPYRDLVPDAVEVLLLGADVARRAAAHWDRAGTEFRPEDGTEVVTGRRTFVTDLDRPGLRHGAVLRPPAYGARLRSADVEPLRHRTGVTAVVEDGFVGVVADSVPESRAALAAIRAEWDAPSSPGEPTIEEYLRAHRQTGDAWDQDSTEVGDVEGALAGSPHIVRATFRTAYIAHVPLEPHAAVAEWSGRRLTVWVGTQTPFRTRDTVAESMGLAVEDVRVVVPPTGAGFGGKHGGEIASAAARLARAAGVPVRVVFTREEEFRYAYLRPMSIVDVAAGLDREGRISAWSFHNVNGGSAALDPPYAIHSSRIDNELSASPLPQGSYRALGATANNFARECVIDELAHAAQTDPVEFRRRNLTDDRLRVVLDRLVARAGGATGAPAAGHGRGVAVGLEKNARVATLAEVTLGPDRRLQVDRLVTAFEAGAVVHPANLRAQVEGATVMALGGALFEEIRFHGGAIQNASLGQYRVPRFSDLPQIEVELVDRREFPPSGAGETPMIAVAPAIANAVFDVAGERLRALPLRARTVRMPIEEPGVRGATG